MVQLSNLNRKSWVALGLAALLCACDPVGPTSEHALDQSVTKSDESLVGSWYGELNGVEAFVHVVESAKADAALQTFVMPQKERGGSRNWAEALATPAWIGSDGYLSVKVEKFEGENVPDDGYIILRYRSRDHRHLALYAMDPDRVAQAIRSGEITGTERGRIDSPPEELVQFIEKSKANDLFSIQVGYLERTSENGLRFKRSDQARSPKDRIRFWLR